ncbi:MAG: endonuclease/exonuclease/phosphatase family protein [Syntrophobacterales bacterium]|jgi:endonuclease/exonuclease/phosphatase family metal-dependent hydrolase
MVNLLALILATILFFPSAGLTNFENPTNPLVGSQSTFRILTLNVMQRADTPRAQRFANIVDYLDTQPPVHALALQEFSGGSVDSPAGTEDSGADLAGMLGGKYGYYTESSHRYDYFFGLGIFWLEFKVGVLSRYAMDYHAATKLDPAGLNYSDGEEFSGRANVVMCIIDIPGFGSVNLFSTHFYNGPVSELQTQANKLMEFVNQEDQAHPSRATIVSGDMNFVLSTATQGIYDTFLSNGFTDSYREANTDPGYTFGVSEDPYANTDSPRRIDYIFVRGDDLEISSSQVVFDGINGDYVSDHFGVLTEITATPLPSSLLLLGSSLLGLAGLGYRRRRK